MYVLIPSDLSINIESEIQYLERLFLKSNLQLDLVFQSEKFTINSKLRKGADDAGIPESVAKRCEELFEKYSSIQNVFLVKEKLEDEVETIAKNSAYDLVVSLTDGTDNFMDFLFGTTTQHFVNNLDTCVLSIPRNADLNHERKILLLYDFQEEDSWNRDLVKKLQEKGDFDIDVLHISETEDSEIKNTIEADLSYSRINAKDIYVFQARNFEEGLMNFLDNYDAQSLAKGSKQRKGLSHLFLGSTAENIMNQIPKPIFIFKNDLND